MIEDRCVICRERIVGADRERFESRYDRHQKEVHNRPVTPGGVA